MKIETATIEKTITFDELNDGGLLEVTDFKNGVNQSSGDLRFSLNGFSGSDGQVWGSGELLVLAAKKVLTIKTRMSRAKVLVRNGD